MEVCEKESDFVSVFNNSKVLISFFFVRPCTCFSIYLEGREKDALKILYVLASNLFMLHRRGRAKIILNKNKIGEFKIGIL